MYVQNQQNIAKIGREEVFWEGEGGGGCPELVKTMGLGSLNHKSGSTFTKEGNMCHDTIPQNNFMYYQQNYKYRSRKRSAGGYSNM